MIRYRWLALAAMLVFTTYSHAQISFTGFALTEDFNTLSSAAGAYSATAGVQSAVPGLTTWRGAKIAGTGTGAMNHTADTGSATAGALYTYSQPTGNTERALGALASGTNTGAFGIEIVNNSGNPITEFTLSFDREQYRSSTTTQNILTFSYVLGAGGSTTFLTDGTAIAVSQLNAVGLAPVASNGEIPVDVAAVSATVSLANAWNPGDSLYLRWQDTNDAGNDAGLAIDNFNFTAVPEPTTCALIGMTVLGSAVWYRRRNKGNNARVVRAK